MFKFINVYTNEVLEVYKGKLTHSQKFNIQLKLSTIHQCTIRVIEE